MRQERGRKVMQLDCQNRTVCGRKSYSDKRCWSELSWISQCTINRRDWATKLSPLCRLILKMVLLMPPSATSRRPVKPRWAVWLVELVMLLNEKICLFHTKWCRATTPEASFHLHGCHLTAVSLGVILTRGGRLVRFWTFHCFPVNSKIRHEWTK